MVGIAHSPLGTCFYGPEGRDLSVLGYWQLSALVVFVIAIALLHCFCDCK